MREAAADALRRIDRRLATVEWAGNLFYGLSLGSVLLLAALGLAITFGLMGVINMAHGELLMIGAYVTYVVQTLFRAWLPGWLDWYVAAALPLAFLVTALVGMALERTVIRWLYGRPLETLLATWGISLMLMQGVRSLFGAQNVEVGNPGWMSGGVTVLGGLVLSYNRLVIIGFALAVVALVWVLLNHTRLGLFVRAITQNRRMADCTGVPTGRVDMLAFGLGSGIAGLAGVALSQLGNVGPDLGRGYIVDSFMVVVLGGVGQLAGTVIAALGLGGVKIPGTLCGSGHGQDHHPGAYRAVCAKAAARLFARAERRMKPAAQDPGLALRRPLYSPRLGGAGHRRRAALLPLLNLAYSPGHPLHVSSYAVALLVKFMCYALAALALDLVWGYAGILSLGHGLFFALGGYAHGMYLMRAIGRDGAYQSTLPDFMVFLDWKSYPWYWSYTEHFWYAMLLVVLVPGALAFLFGYFAFRSRIKGVYFSIITQALTFAAMLLFFRNDTGFGNNGFTDFKRILGHDITAPGTRAALLVHAGGAGRRAGAGARRHAVKLGRVLTAVRDSETGCASSATSRWASSSSSGRCRPCSAALPARCTCRRSASSIPARCPPRTPSKW